MLHSENLDSTSSQFGQEHWAEWASAGVSNGGSTIGRDLSETKLFWSVFAVYFYFSKMSFDEWMKKRVI